LGSKLNKQYLVLNHHAQQLLKLVLEKSVKHGVAKHKTSCYYGISSVFCIVSFIFKISDVISGGFYRINNHSNCSMKQ